ncbi:unnamed protein product [Nesidiocoris tenuis]|uniref:Tudor domain-containing protein n=1 Tax=Nesidiocoris tenuis TaxID=355587 RepID=A0A6H5GPN4_9HEMI|nr:unnamed protein product [Nesidiocoris tenuis]
MLRGDSRQLLILGIPTITLVFGLLFLRRRRRKRGIPHTDPGGITGIKPNLELEYVENGRETFFQKVETQIVGSEVAGPEIDRKFEIEEPNIAAIVELSSPNKLENSSVEILEVEKKVEVQVKEEPIVQIIDLTEDVSEIIDLTEDDSRTIDLLDSDESFSTNREEGELTCSSISDCSLSDKLAVVEENLSKIEVSSEENCSSRRAAGLSSAPRLEDQKNLSADKSLEEGEILDSSIEEDDSKVTEGVEVLAEKPELEKEEKPADSKMEKHEQAGLENYVNLELDAMSISTSEERKGSSERDSANHSPSEVMLASPSISNFSDAHSEGSSDSGKGHSDVAISPSRTPAGGSSLAGDVALSVYEFILPQNIVGRLIGRHGASLHEIRTSTGTNIFIKRHPATNKLKICAIEGTPQDIDKALSKIRQKFPLRRFPNLTLEKVPFVSLNSIPPLRVEDLHLQLIEGVNNDVILSSLISAAHYFLQQPSHPTYGSLSALNAVMNNVYSLAEAPLLDPPIKDAVCAVATMGGWYRAQIISVEEDNKTAYVRFLDYGGYLIVSWSAVRQIRGDLLTLPFQAVECYLANVAPIGRADQRTAGPPRIRDAREPLIGKGRSRRRRGRRINPTVPLASFPRLPPFPRKMGENSPPRSSK